jgi:hypothetical protein
MPSLRVEAVFDTSSIKTENPSFLYRLALPTAAEDLRQRPLLKLGLHFPSMVLDERRHQMRVGASAWAAHHDKAQKFLGRPDRMTEEAVSRMVDVRILNDLTSVSAHELTLDQALVNWPRLLQDAAFRRPPFDDAEKTEKGFRDAIIGETFLQLASRGEEGTVYVLVTGDKLLTAMVEQRSAALARDIVVVNDIERLVEAITIRLLGIPEHNIELMRRSAKLLFARPMAESGLLAEKGIVEAIKRDILAVIGLDTDIALNSVLTTLQVEEPEFLGEADGRVRWVTTLRFRLPRLQTLLGLMGYEAPPLPPNLVPTYFGSFFGANGPYLTPYARSLTDDLPSPTSSDLFAPSITETYLGEFVNNLKATPISGQSLSDRGAEGAYWFADSPRQAVYRIQWTASKDADFSLTDVRIDSVDRTIEPTGILNIEDKPFPIYPPRPPQKKSGKANTTET